ncbi:MAG: LapA family protein [Desulfatitalea sp.]|nr:LapA family protein [Desulfatitalea sp.]
MKKIKLIFWIIILGFLGLIVYQNKALLMDGQRLTIDLAFASYQTPELPFVLFFAFMFLLGWLIAYLFGVLARLKSGKTIKKLKETINSQAEAIVVMKNDIESLKPHAHHSTSAPVETHLPSDSVSDDVREAAASSEAYIHKQTSTRE